MNGLSIRSIVLISLAFVVSVDGQQLGVVFEDPEIYRDIPLAMPPLRGDVPAKVDLSSSFPEPSDQGDQGSCVGWATAYALKSYLEKKERQWPGKADRQRFSPAYIYNQIKLDGGGAHLTSALDLLIREGVATLSDFPYKETDDTRIPSSEVRQAAREYAIASWRRVDPEKTSDVKAHLASGFPVLIGMRVAASFMRHGSSRTYHVTPGEDDEGGHAMCVVGYDQRRRAFKLINSWGTDWGEGGYAWVGFDSFTKKVVEAYVVQDIVIYHPDKEVNPQPDNFDPKPNPASPWIFADSSRRRLNPSELRVRSARELWRARNEIYARHGYRFKSAHGEAFAKSLGHDYTPRSGDVEAIEAQFNDTEHYNIALIISFEHSRPNPVGPLPANPWVFPDSSARRLIAEDLRNRTANELWRARNEIFARHGYIFQSAKGKAFARSLGVLYTPVSSDMDRIYERLSPIEQHNVQLIKRIEN